MTISITVKYGATRSYTKEFTEPVTVAQVLRDESVRAALGFGEQVQALNNGVVLDNSDVLDDGDEIVVEKVAAQKAA